MTDWQPIETAPRDGTVVDLWVDGERLPDCRWTSPWPEEVAPHWRQRYQEAGPDCTFPVDGEPSYWMPLPPPPVEKT